MAKSSPVSASKKAMSAKGTPTLHNFFSVTPKNPSPPKRPTYTENTASAKRARHLPGDGTSKAPLQLLDGNTESHSNVIVNGSHVASHGTLGLVHIRRAEDSPMTLKARRNEAFILNAGDFLGRTVPKPPKEATDALKGVSRKHVQVLEVQPDSVMIRNTGVNSVGLYRHIPETRKMNRTVEDLEKGEFTTLRLGDVIEFDNYNRADARHAQPMHVFRVVNLTEQRGEPRACSSLAVSVGSPLKMLSMNTSKSANTNDEMEVDTDPASQFSNDTYVVYDDVDDSPTSFFTARESLLPEEVVDSAPFTAEARDSGASTKRYVALAPTRQEVPVVSLKIPLHKEDVQENSGFSVTAPPSQTDANTTAALFQSTDIEVTSGTPMDTAEHEPAAEASPTILFAQSGGRPKECIPKVGDRFRVVYERKSEENFMGHALPSWFNGIVNKVTVNKKPKTPQADWKPYNLHFTWDDASRTDGIGYPSPDVQLLIVDDVNGSAYVEMEDGSHIIAYHRDMTKLAIGDLVDCLYQGGVENGARFRGRVAAIDVEANTCDVSYCDREYERNVPIDKAYLCVVENGQATPTWLEGLDVPVDYKNMDTNSRKGPNKHKSGKIVKIGQRGNSQDEELVLKIKFPGGRFESAPYSQVARVIFAQTLESTDAAQIRFWPALMAHKTNPLARRRELRGDPIVIDANDAFDYNPDVLCDEKVSDEFTSNEEPTQPSRNIPAPTSNLFAGAIKSVQAQFGVELLSQLLVSHNFIPHVSLTKTLYETVIYGPKSDGTYYPDPRKVELVSNYLIGACSNFKMRSNLIEMATSRWSFIEETLHQVIADIYRFEGDRCSSSNAALSRISSSLQVAASGLNLLLTLMKYQLKPAIQDPDKIGQIRDQPIVRAFLECKGGIHGVFKCIVRMNVIAWTHYGHFLVGDPTELYAHDPSPEPANVHSCSEQARKVIQTLAQITSYTAWLYSVDQRLSIDKKSFASTIVDVLNNELSTNKVDLDPYNQSGKKLAKAAVNKYWEMVKLRFALDLSLVQEPFSRPLHLTVAGVLGLRKKYDYLFDD